MDCMLVGCPKQVSDTVGACFQLPASFSLFFRACTLRASLVSQMLKSRPAMQETWVQSLDREDPLE